MKLLQELSKEINDLTLKFEQEYPELNTKTFSDYLDSLKQKF